MDLQVDNKTGTPLKLAQIKPAQVAGLNHSPPRPKTYQIEARNLFYNLPSSHPTPWNRHPHKPSKTILTDVSCEARAGGILAIAGPSGAGKSTLLELLAGRLKPTSGPKSVLVNRHPMNAARFRRLSGYVTQDDALFPLLTVEETLMFSARLRLPSSVPHSEKLARVRALISELGLSHVARSRVGQGGDNNRGISGGERRRVSIGVDVIHDPAVLLLDEPTSGLDSAVALQITRLLKHMAESHGRTVVLSIHQPGHRILQLFDSVVLLCQGTVVHHGSLDALSLRLHLSGHLIPPHVNVLEYAIDVIDTLTSKTPPPTTIAFAFQHPPSDDVPMLRNLPFYANSPVREIGILSHRFAKNTVRTKQLFAARTVQALVAGVALGTVFMNAGTDNAGLQDRMGFFAFTLTFLLSSTTEGLPIFLEERNILMRETSRGSYRVSSYVLANAIVFFPFMLIIALLYAVPVYWLIGLSPQPGAFLYFVLIVWLVICMANSFVVCFSALVPNFIMGNSAIAGFMGGFFLFSGYFISKQNIPNYWIWMHYLSMFKYPFEGFIINEYSNLGQKCLQKVKGRCVLDGNGLLRQQGLEEVELWSNLGVIAMFIVVYRVLCFCILWYRCSWQRR